MLARKDFEEFKKDFDVKSFFKNITIHEEFPVIDDIVLAFRDYRWVTPYIKHLLSPDYGSEKATVTFLDNYGIPGADSFLRRISETTRDAKIKELAIANKELMNIWEDFKKIKTRKRFFIEGALGSIQNRTNLAMPLTIKLFKLELERLGWDLKDASDDELRSKFKVLLAHYTNPDDSESHTLKLNMRCLKELISLVY